MANFGFDKVFCPNFQTAISQKHSVHPPLCRGLRGEIEPPTKFSKKGGIDRTSTFRWGLLEIRGGGEFFQGGLQFSHKE